MSEELLNEQTEIDNQARTIQAEYDVAIKAIEADSTLSDEGKQVKRLTADNIFNQKQTDVATKATIIAQRLERAYQKEQVKSQTSSIANRRTVLSDAIYADVQRHRLNAMPTSQVTQAIADAQSLSELAPNNSDAKFNLELLQALGDVIAHLRSDDPESLNLRRQLLAETPDNRLEHAVKRSADWLKQLNKGAYRSELASIYNVDPQFIDA